MLRSPGWFIYSDLTFCTRFGGWEVDPTLSAGHLLVKFGGNGNKLKFVRSISIIKSSYDLTIISHSEPKIVN